MRDMNAAPDRQASRVVAVTGAYHFLGTELIKQLEEDRRYARIIALDLRKPDIPLEKTEFYELDLTVPAIDGELAELLRAWQVDTVVHTAFLSYPTHATEWAHELEEIGTMHVLNACAEAKPSRFVMTSTTMVYGASPRNPNYLSESHELAQHSDSRFISDKIHAEHQVQRFARENPRTRVCVLRFAPIVGPTVSNLFTRFFSRPVAPVIMGHDPLLQFVHESDAAMALKLATDRMEAEGAFNIVGRGVLPYTTVLALMGRMSMPVPYMLARPLAKALWMTQVMDSPPSFLDFLRYLCVADGERAQRELDFRARYTITNTVLDFLGIGSEDGSPDPARVYG